MIDFWLRAGKANVFAVIVTLVGVIAFIDWVVGNSVSLGVLYILPMMLSAVVFRPFESALLAFLCAYLRARFDTPGSQVEVILRFIFASLSYFASGLFVTALVRNRRLMADHLGKIQKEQARRLEAEEEWRFLVASPPAAILPLDGNGIVLADNDAAVSLFAIPANRTLRGQAIADYLPVLS